MVVVVVVVAGPGCPVTRSSHLHIWAGDWLRWPFSNPLTYNPSLMRLEEGALNRNRLRPLLLSAGQSLPFKGLMRLPNPPQGPNAIVSLLQLCWEAWAWSFWQGVHRPPEPGRHWGHLWGTSWSRYQAWEKQETVS